VELGQLAVPVFPRLPTPSHIPGYEINHNLGARIAFAPDQPGGYDLSFGLDGKAQHSHKTTLSIILSDSN